MLTQIMEVKKRRAGVGWLSVVAGDARALGRAFIFIESQARIKSA
jgi:hypothetical protein